MRNFTKIGEDLQFYSLGVGDLWSSGRSKMPRIKGVLFDILGRGVMRPKSSTTDIYLNACAKFGIKAGNKDSVRRAIADVHFERWPLPGPRFIGDGDQAHR